VGCSWKGGRLWARAPGSCETSKGLCGLPRHFEGGG